MAGTGNPLPNSFLANQNPGAVAQSSLGQFNPLTNEGGIANETLAQILASQGNAVNAQLPTDLNAFMAAIQGAIPGFNNALAAGSGIGSGSPILSAEDVSKIEVPEAASLENALLGETQSDQSQINQSQQALQQAIAAAALQRNQQGPQQNLAAGVQGAGSGQSFNSELPNTPTGGTGAAPPGETFFPATTKTPPNQPPTEGDPDPGGTNTPINTYGDPGGSSQFSDPLPGGNPGTDPTSTNGGPGNDPNLFNDGSGDSGGGYDIVGEYG